MQLNVFINSNFVGILSNDPLTNIFLFEYSEKWISREGSFEITPWLPFKKDNSQSPLIHSAIVRQFFDNLLPEGKGLDTVSIFHQVSKSNLVGLMLNVGQDMAGAIKVQSLDFENSQCNTLRHLPFAELSERIRNRNIQPFPVWDGKIRLSVAGFQDKIVAFEYSNRWSFAEGPDVSSNIIIKPEPTALEMAGMTGNEFMCMKLAHAAGLPVAPVRIQYVPEPVLVISRFDRKTSEDGKSVERIHVIDGCQALGISSSYKYERPYCNNNSSNEIKNMRDGASLPRIFELLENSENPANQKIELLRWTIFQALISNTDAHAKNISFFCDASGLRLTPAYDLLCAPAFSNQPNLEDSFAMAIGDTFKPSELSAFEWAEFAVQCNLTQKIVGSELKRLAILVEKVLPKVVEMAKENNVPDFVINQVSASIILVCRQQLKISKFIKDIDPELLSESKGAAIKKKRATKSKFTSPGL